jgi:hypothetical protein
MNQQSPSIKDDIDQGKLEPTLSYHFDEDIRYDHHPPHLDRLFMAGFKNDDVATITSKSSSPAVSKSGTRKSMPLMSSSASPFISQQKRLSITEARVGGIASKAYGQQYPSSSKDHDDQAFTIINTDNNEQIFWRRKKCNSQSPKSPRNVPQAPLGNVPPPPPSSLVTPSIRNGGAPRKRPPVIRTSSGNRQRSTTAIIEKTKGNDPTQNWNGSPEEFLRNDEIFWHRKGQEMQNTRMRAANKDSAPGHSSVPPPPAPFTSSAVIPLRTNSMSSFSLNSRSETSLISSSSSASSDSKSPRLRRKGLGSQTVTLRKQMREQQRAELKIHAVSSSIEINVGETPTPILEQSNCSQWNVLSGRSPPSRKSRPSRTNSDRSMEIKLSVQCQNSRPQESNTSSQTTSSTSPEGRPRLTGVYRDPTGAVVNYDDSPITEVPATLSRTRSQGKSRGGPSMRSLLRNKRKLEKELHQNDVFHFVLHKCPLTSFQKQTSVASLGNTTATSTSSNSRGAVPMSIKRHNAGSTSADTITVRQSDSKMPLERFLIMKHRSEQLAVQKRDGGRSHQRGNAISLSTKARHHEPQPVEDTWHDSHLLDNFVTTHDRGGSVGQQPIESVLSLLRMVDDADRDHIDDIDDEDRTIETEDLNDTSNHPPHEMENQRLLRDNYEADSFISLDGKDLPSAWSHERDDSASISDLVATAYSDDLKFGAAEKLQTSSQSLNDLIVNEQQDGDSDEQHEALEDSCGNFDCDDLLAKPHREVKNYTMVDPSGRMSTYSGPISSSSGMPDGMGRLEYNDRGEIFIGQFVHGWWSGYGTCRCTTTGEVYTGFFVDYVKHGYGVCKYADGSVFEGTFDAGCKVEGRVTYPDQSSYVGKFEKGKGDVRCGRGTYTFSNGAVFLGAFQDDCIHSGVLTYTNGSRFIGRWSRGLRHGPGKEFRPDGSLGREGVWKEGKFVS